LFSFFENVTFKLIRWPSVILQFNYFFFTLFIFKLEIIYILLIYVVFLLIYFWIISSFLEKYFQIYLFDYSDSLELLSYQVPNSTNQYQIVPNSTKQCFFLKTQYQTPYFGKIFNMFDSVKLLKHYIFL